MTKANHESDGPVNASAKTSEEDADEFVERPDAEDHDLLTFGEAGARLVEEVRRQQHRIERLQAGGAPDADVEAARRRLASLRAAQERNRQPSLDELRDSGFFGGPLP